MYWITISHRQQPLLRTTNSRAVLTKLALRIRLRNREQVSSPIPHTPSITKTPVALPRIHSLHCQVLAHRLRDLRALLTSLHTLLCQGLDLRTSETQNVRESFPRFTPLAYSSWGTHLFWNQICTERSVMLISWAMRSRVEAVGVGFLLNSASNVTS